VPGLRWRTGCRKTIIPRISRCLYGMGRPARLGAMTKLFRMGAVLAAALLLAGCGILFPTARERAAKNTPGFKAGFSDGCASATQQDTNYRADTVRDDNAYRTDKNYRSGWASGFTNCRTNLSHHVYDPSVGPIPDNNPGAPRN